MTFLVVVPDHVEKEISGIDAWWREHRLAGRQTADTPRQLGQAPSVSERPAVEFNKR